MALGLTDLYLINSMNDRSNIRTRAQTIEDNFGLKPEPVEDYRKKNGGFGIMKALAWVAGGLIVGALFQAAAIGLALGAVAGAVTMAMQNSKMMKGYSSYLDGVSAQGRAEKSLGHGLEVEDSADRAQSFGARIVNERQAGSTAIVKS